VCSSDLEAGFKDTGFFPVDEPHTEDLIQKSQKYCEWIKDVKAAKTFITLNPKAEQVLNPVLDYHCYQISYLNDSTLKKPKQEGHTLMFYTASIGTDPMYTRFTAGYYFAKSEAETMYYFAYMLFEGDPYVDWDGNNRDWNVVYPSMNSKIHDPTVQWEGLREGIDDYKYIYTLRQAIKKADKAGKSLEAGKAERVLEGILKKVSTDGNKAGGPEASIEGDTRLKDTKIDASLLKKTPAQVADSWPDESRRSIAEQIILLGAAVK
jgi:hypothetical protein